MNNIRIGDQNFTQASTASEESALRNTWTLSGLNIITINNSDANREHDHIDLTNLLAPNSRLYKALPKLTAQQAEGFVSLLVETYQDNSAKNADKKNAVITFLKTLKDQNPKLANTDFIFSKLAEFGGPLPEGMSAAAPTPQSAAALLNLDPNTMNLDAMAKLLSNPTTKADQTSAAAQLLAHWASASPANKIAIENFFKLLAANPNVRANSTTTGNVNYVAGAYAKALPPLYTPAISYENDIGSLQAPHVKISSANVNNFSAAAQQIADAHLNTVTRLPQPTKQAVAKAAVVIMQLGTDQDFRALGRVLAQAKDPSLYNTVMTLLKADTSISSSAIAALNNSYNAIKAGKDDLTIQIKKLANAASTSEGMSDAAGGMLGALRTSIIQLIKDEPDASKQSAIIKEMIDAATPDLANTDNEHKRDNLYGMFFGAQYNSRTLPTPMPSVNFNFKMAQTHSNLHTKINALTGMDVTSDGFAKNILALLPDIWQLTIANNSGDDPSKSIIDRMKTHMARIINSTPDAAMRAVLAQEFFGVDSIANAPDPLPVPSENSLFGQLQARFDALNASPESSPLTPEERLRDVMNRALL